VSQNVFLPYVESIMVQAIEGEIFNSYYNIFLDTSINVSAACQKNMKC